MNTRIYNLELLRVQGFLIDPKLSPELINDDKIKFPKMDTGINFQKKSNNDGLISDFVKGENKISSTLEANK